MLHAVGLCLLTLSLAAAQPRDLREAARLDQQGKCDESAPFYDQALATGAASPALLNNAGNHYLLCGQQEKARAQFERLLKINPAHTNANLQMARMAVDHKQGDKALVYLSKVTISEPGIRLLHGEALHWAGKHAEALEELTTLEAQVSNNPTALLAVGGAFARLGNFDRAEQAFQRLLVQAPDNFDVLYQLGRSAARAHHYDRAQSVLGAALKLRPGNVDVLLELGLAHAAAKDYSRAVYLLAQAKQGAPKRSDIVLALARAAEDAEFYGDSAIAYDEYVRLQPGDVIARRDRARVLGYTDARMAEGIKEMESYIRAYPTDPVGYYNLAQFTWKTDTETSLEQLATALRLNPDFTPAHVSRAWLLHRSGRSSEAATHLEAALARMPQNLRALDQLGTVYLALDRPTDAEKALRRAMVINPSDPDVLMHLARTLMALNRESESQQLLDRYQQIRPGRHRSPRRDAGMIGLATLPESERQDHEIARFRRLSQARPDDPTLQWHLAELLLASGRLKESTSEFNRLLDMNADPQTHESAGRALLAADQYALARRFLERAVADRDSARLDLAIAVLRSEGPDAALRVIDETPQKNRTGDFFLAKAGILDASGKRKEAGDLLSEGMRGTTTRPDFASQAAMQLLRYGRETDALDIITRAVAATPNSSDVLLTHAIVLAVAGNTEQAEFQLKSLEARWPEWDRPHLVYGLLLESSRRNVEAVRHLKTAVALGSQEPAARCALARLSGQSDHSGCDCVGSLREFAAGTCTVR